MSITSEKRRIIEGRERNILEIRGFILGRPRSVIKDLFFVTSRTNSFDALIVPEQILYRTHRELTTNNLVHSICPANIAMAAQKWS